MKKRFYNISKMDETIWTKTGKAILFFFSPFSVVRPTQIFGIFK